MAQEQMPVILKAIVGHKEGHGLKSKVAWAKVPVLITIKDGNLSKCLNFLIFISLTCKWIIIF